MKTFKHSLWLLSALLSGQMNSNAQMSIPQPEDVYGGRINSITSIRTGVDSSRIFISTESANTLLYADVYAPGGVTPVFGTFQVMPGADDNAGYGAYINNIAAHELSGHVFFLDEADLLSTHPSSSSVNSAVSGVNSFTIKESTLLYCSMTTFHWGTLDANGLFSQDTMGPIASPASSQMAKIVVSEYDGLVYIMEEGTSPKLYVSSDPYTSFTSSTTFTDISPTGVSAGNYWVAAGVGRDGRLFINGSGNMTQYVAYSDDKLNWTEITVGVGGGTGPNFAFSGSSTQYSVYFASVYSDSNGVAGTWQKFGDVGGYETHPNDGAVLTNPTNPDIVYMTTDQGLGASNTKGVNIYEIDEGIEAVQVKDFDMTSDKNTAWLAAKSGIRQVTNYLTTPTWTNAFFPNEDGSPYYSIAMDPVSPNTVFAGNTRVYKTSDAGANWTRAFTAEDSPYLFASTDLYVKAIEVCPYDNNVVFAGYYAEGTDKGGLFYSMDNGSSWEQLLIEATSSGKDVDVRDIIFNVEGSDTVAYVGVEYDLADPQGVSVYRIVKDGSNWDVLQDFDATHTSVGYQITATINDLHKSMGGDTVFACGTDAGVNEPHVYVKILSGSGLWEPMTVNGFPYSTGTEGKAVTMGGDTVFCAVDNEIYYLIPSATSWTLGYTYPVGNEINFLYYDELLVGAGTGLYGQTTNGLSSGIVSVKNENENLKIYPNPVKKSASITYTINSDEFVKLSLHDMMGREIESLVNDNKTAGTYKVHINAEKLAKGMYVIKLEAGNVVSVQDIVIE
jgi:hypothetical protein